MENDRARFPRRRLLQATGATAASGLLPACDPTLNREVEVSSRAAAVQAVRGYANTTSIAPGGPISFHLSAVLAGTYTLQIWRAWDPAPAQTLIATISNRSIPANGWEGYNWPATITVSGSATNLPTGLYFLVVDGAKVVAFVIRPAAPGAASKVLFAVDFLTMQAYNDAGGKSLYDFNSCSPATPGCAAKRVSFDREVLSSLDGMPELSVISWLNGQSRPVEYGSTVDLHASASLLDPYDCLVIAGHVEYWTKEMRDRAEAFVARGKNMIVLSGNTCYWQARLESNNRTLVVYRTAGADPVTDPARKTVTWTSPPLNRPQNELLGVGWTHGAWETPGGARAYDLEMPSHWALDGVSATQTAPFMTYETDAAPYVRDETGYPHVTGEEETPLSFTILGTADLRDWRKPGFATMGIYTRGGTVFNAGAIEWPFAMNQDPVISRISSNVFARLSAPRPFDWELVGHANGGAGMAAIDGKLILTTQDGGLWRRHPVLTDVNWHHVGSAPFVRSLAASADTLFAITPSNELLWRPAGDEGSWSGIGAGPAGDTRALAATGGVLYALDQDGVLWRRPATRLSGVWQPIPSQANTTITAMTAYAGSLYACTSTGRLLRTQSEDFSRWHDIWHCNFGVGLAAVDFMLFVVTSENRLWWLDLTLLNVP